MARIGKFPCPSGEQITNGRFETGDFTGWTIHSGMVSDPEIATSCGHGDPPYNGTYCCSFGNGGDWYGAYIEQEPIKDVPTRCVEEFYFYKYGSHPVSPPAGSKTKITIFYSDDTTTIVNHETSDANDLTWEKIDLKPYLEAEKTITKIRIERDDDYGGWYNCVDEVHLIC